MHTHTTPCRRKLVARHRTGFGAAVFLLLAACHSQSAGDDSVKPTNASTGGASGKGGTSGGVTTQSCTPSATLTLQSLAPASQLGWYVATASDGTTTLTVRVELNEDGVFHQTAGSFDLSMAPDTDYATCNHCVIGYQGGDGEGPETASSVYYASAGTLTLANVTSPPSGASKGALHGVVLSQVTLDPDTWSVTPMQGGGCLALADVQWDTTADPTKDCQSGSDCGDAMNSACDPATKKCVTAACALDGSQSCGDGMLCLQQSMGASYGACYIACSVGDTTCPMGMDCVSTDSDGITGRCLWQGTAAEGQPCTPSDVATGCAPGLVCQDEGDQSVCRTPCSVWDTTESCPSGQACSYGGVCGMITGDPAAIGAACAATSPFGAPCGQMGATWQGACVDDGDGTPVTCHQVCRVSSVVFADCADGQVCQLSDGENPIGVCVEDLEP